MYEFLLLFYDNPKKNGKILFVCFCQGRRIQIDLNSNQYHAMVGMLLSRLHPQNVALIILFLFFVFSILFWPRPKYSPFWGLPAFYCRNKSGIVWLPYTTVGSAGVSP